MKENRARKHNSTASGLPRPVLALALSLALLALVGLGLTLRADGSPFDGSSVIPTASEARVGEEVGFALYVVHSAPLTATDVLVWNPLPAGTTYVAASGGAFPVIGTPLEGGLATLPPEGQAYHARLQAAVPLTDAAQVSGIAWVGAIPPGGMQALGLIITVTTAPEAGYVGNVAQIYHRRRLAFSARATVPVLSHRRYLPAVSRSVSQAAPPPATTKAIVPLARQPVIMTGKGDSLAEAQSGPDFVLASQSLYASVHHPDGYYPFYAVARTYLQFDATALAALPGDRVQQVDLVLYPNANDDPCARVDVRLHTGTWEALDASAWDALDQPLASFRADEALTAVYTVTLAAPDDPARLQRLVMTVDEAAIPPPDCAWNGLKVGFFADDPGSEATTHLVVWVEEE